MFFSPILAIVVPKAIDAAQLRFFNTPEQVLTQFYTEKGVAEDQLMDPLILGGPKIVPILEKEVLKKDIPRRRYAIVALGIIGDKNSIPSLERILQNWEENEYFRGAALRAIALIDLPTAQAVASQYINEPGHVSKMAKAVLLSDPSILEKRSNWAAFFRVHD